MSEHEREELPEALSRLLTLDDADGPAQHLDAVQSKALIDAVLDASAPAATGTPRGRARGSLWPWAAAAILVGIGTAAAFYVARQPASPPATRPAPVNAPAPARAVEADTPETEALEEAPSEASPAPEIEPDAPAARPARTEDLMLQANRLRGEGRYRAAAQTYLRVVKRAPDSAAASVAHVAAADIRLEQLGDPRGALALYRKALSAPGALAVEAHAGVARAYRALGDQAAEARALEALLSSHPRGPSADWARARLSALRSD